MPIGPTLPPHLAKRNRDDDNDQDDGASSPNGSEKRRRVAGPAPPPSAVGPALPPDAPSPLSSGDGDAGPAPSQPIKRVAGPAPPPAPLFERPPNPPNHDSDSDSSSDDDFGPAPPPAGGPSYTSYNDNNDNDKLAPSAFDTDPTYTDEAKKPARDEWMTMPPTQDDLAARMDPTKLRARKFNTGKSATTPSSGPSSAWTETPSQKLQRLQNEAMGITTSSSTSTGPQPHSKKSKQEEERRARKIQDKINATRGKSLVEQHMEKGSGREKEDDPSKRAFDYEKDMAVIGTANHKQRREVVSKSKDFGGRFSGGGFL